MERVFVNLPAEVEADLIRGLNKALEYRRKHLEEVKAQEDRITLLSNIRAYEESRRQVEGAWANRNNRYVG